MKARSAYDWAPAWDRDLHPCSESCPARTSENSVVLPAGRPCLRTLLGQELGRRSLKGARPQSGGWLTSVPRSFGGHLPALGPWVMWKCTGPAWNSDLTARSSATCGQPDWVTSGRFRCEQRMAHHAALGTSCHPSKYAESLVEGEPRVCSGRR